MSELITQHCALLEQWKESGDLCQDRDDILNDLQTELIRLQSTNVVQYREQMNKVINLLSYEIINLNNSILTFLMDYFIVLLKTWHESRGFNDKNDSNTLEKLEQIFQRDLDNFMNELLIKEFDRCLDTIARIGKNLYTNPDIRIITRILTIYIRIQTDYGTQFMEPSQLDDSIIKCFLSPYVPDIFSQFKSSLQSDERTVAENFVFDGLIYYISLMYGERVSQSSLDLRKHLLLSMSDLLDEFLKSPDNCSVSSLVILTDLTTLFLYNVNMTESTDECLDIQKHMCDTALRILLLPTYRSMKLNKNCTQHIYMCTLNDKILDELKRQQLTSKMFEISNFYKNETEIQFNIYRILAAIMTEEDIKKLDDPGAIAKVFLDHLDEIKDIPGWETRIKNLLATLKTLLQHDQIRDEIYKQNGVSLFIYCATAPKYETLIQQRALENLLIMSFNENVRLNLKENLAFMTHIKSLSENSIQSDLQRAVDSLLWVLAKDDNTTKNSSENEDPKTIYDVMISYSHKDQDLCFQLYDRLVKDHYRVWLDRDQMHGTPLESMSNAIENSEFVFVCMSDAYKQSGYCKMEAYYALERQCSIIPLVMKSQYKPDGWLGIIVTGRMRIDFPKHGFENAYKKLMVEIDRSRKEKKKENPMYHHETPSITKPPTVNPVKEEKPSYQTKNDHRLPTDIEQWTVDDVQQFFIKQHLEKFLPICERMNGRRLVGLYQMCTTNSPIMFQSLNNQLSVTNTDEKSFLIAIDEYLQFLEDLKPFAPVSFEKKEPTASQSSICTIL